MFKLVVLTALLAVASAKPSAWPLAHLAPVVHALPAAVSHQSRVDIHSTPIIAAAPLHHAALPLAAPWALGPHTPATVLSPWGVPLDTADVVAAKALHYQAHALAAHGPHYIRKRSLLAAPLIVAPSAVSHQSRVDVHSTPVISHYAAPWVSHYAPAPLISHLPALGHGVWAPRAYSVHPW